jgi:7-carboxy-7-deazaguanine synthase
MFGHNEKLGKSHFKAAGDRLLVTSAFMTLQGEGPLRGEAAFFIRLARCNLSCSFCDTYFDSGDWLSLNDIETLVDDKVHDFFGGRRLPAWTNGSRFNFALVVTGGEPTLQPNLNRLLDWGEFAFTKTQIESNGIVPADVPRSTILVISPKCVEKAGTAVAYMKPHKHNLERADCLKFVMSADLDSPYSSVPDWVHDWQRQTGKQVFVSPMNMYLREPAKAKELYDSKHGQTLDQRSTAGEIISFWEPGLLDMKANERNHIYAANYAIRHGFVFNMQLHLFAAVA